MSSKERLVVLRVGRLHARERCDERAHFVVLELVEQRAARRAHRENTPICLVAVEGGTTRVWSGTRSVALGPSFLTKARMAATGSGARDVAHEG